MPHGSSWQIHRASIIFCVVTYGVLPVLVFLSLRRAMKDGF